MADYYPLIAKAVAGLERNTGEGRRALYERARTALVAQLRGVVPALSESDITRERLALEEAIRKVEGEAARRVRPESSRPPEPVRADSVQDRAAVGANAPGRGGGRAELRAPPPEPPPQRTAPPPRNRSPGDRGSLTDQGLKGFRDVIAEANDLGAATAQAGKSARQAYAAVPSPHPELDRIEPRIEPDGFRGPLRDDDPSVHEPHMGDSDAAQMPHGRYGEVEEYGHAPRPPRSYLGLIKIAVAIGVIGAVAALGYWQRVNIGSLLAMRGSPSQPIPNPPSSSQKDPRPFRSSGQEQPGQSMRNAAPNAAVAQRVMLYEEDPGDPKGKSFVGSAVWRIETVSPGSGGAPELAVRADVEIPERKMKMSWSLRRNTDKALPASHTIEVMFTLPPDFPSGGIADVRGILMKQAEQARGVPLSGLGVKVTNNFFLIGLSSTEDEMKRNTELLRDRGWFDVPIIYTNGRRAILALEKGTPGERAFGDAFAAWQQK
jgi:hypothetical protein